MATTADTVRTAIQFIGKAPGVETVSSFFLMLLPPPLSRAVVFADFALVVHPTPEELASIAISSAASFQAMTSETPRVAMLSFSTMGSAKHEAIDRVATAVPIVKSRQPDMIIDGEIQFDAAVIPEVGRTKAPDSVLDGNANVFIFPNLDSGNIGYKIEQRIGGGRPLVPSCRA